MLRVEVSAPLSSACSPSRRVALLVGGDAAAMLLFASIGRVSHGEGLSLGGALATICPADKKLLHGMRDAVLVPTGVVNNA